MMNYNNSNFDEYYKEYQDNLKDYPLDEQTYLNSGVKRVLQQRAKENLPNPPGALTVNPKSQNSTPSGPKSYVEPSTRLLVTRPGETPQTISGAKPGAKTTSPFETLPKANYTGDAYNPDGYRAPSTEGQGVVAGDPVTKFEFVDTSKSYNPKGYEINNSSEVSTTTPTPESPQATTETPQTEEQKRDDYFRKLKEESTQLENKAIASRMKPQIVEAMKSGNILKAQSILTDYKSVFTREFIKEIQKTIDRMNPKTYGIDRSDRNANALTKYLYRLLQNQSKKAFDGIESKFDSFNIKPDDKVKFIYFRNNLKDIVGELFNYSYLSNLPQ
jgi:hypothetical protein